MVKIKNIYGAIATLISMIICIFLLIGLTQYRHSIQTPQYQEALLNQLAAMNVSLESLNITMDTFIQLTERLLFGMMFYVAMIFIFDVLGLFFNKTWGYLIAGVMTIPLWLLMSITGSWVIIMVFFTSLILHFWAYRYSKSPIANTNLDNVTGTFMGDYHQSNLNGHTLSSEDGHNQTVIDIFKDEDDGFLDKHKPYDARSNFIYNMLHKEKEKKLKDKEIKNPSDDDDESLK